MLGLNIGQHGNKLVFTFEYMLPITQMLTIFLQCVYCIVQYSLHKLNGLLNYVFRHLRFFATTNSENSQQYCPKVKKKKFKIFSFCSFALVTFWLLCFVDSP